MTSVSTELAGNIPETASRVPIRRGELGLALQEVLTVVCRLKAGRTSGTRLRTSWKCSPKEGRPEPYTALCRPDR